MSQLLGTLVNVATVLAGGGIGLLCKKGLSEKVSDTLMKGLGLCTLLIGISGALDCDTNMVIVILSLVLGALIGEWVDLDRLLNKLGERLQQKVTPGKSGNALATGFVTASLVFCVGAMSIVGPLESGISGDHTVQYTKAMMDFVSSMVFASQFGVGVLFAAIIVLVYQGGITLLAGWIGPYLTTAVVDGMSCVGYVIIIGLALNILGITKLKIMNYIPGIFVAMAIMMLL